MIAQRRSALLAFLLAWLPVACVAAESALIAVASNFQEPIRTLAADFQKQTSMTLEFSFGATGRHYAQIRNGAPFDALFAADAERPALLEMEGQAIEGTRFTYAIGRLALWSSEADYVDSEGAVLTSGGFRRLAIAKPDLAPYGAAARQVLERRGLWAGLRPRIVYGESITQTFQFVETGNAELGFIAWSQVKAMPESRRGSFWLVPPDQHGPIRQDAILLRENPAARTFLRYVKSEKAKARIRAFGYEVE